MGVVALHSKHSFCSLCLHGRFRYVVSATLFGVPLPLPFGNGNPPPDVANPGHLLPTLFGSRCLHHFGTAVYCSLI
jgi:hypothetical protein